MQNQLNKISDQERKMLLDAPALITALIAGSDGGFNQAEEDWAEKVVGFRKDTAHYSLHYFYELVGENFHQKMEAYHKMYENMPNRADVIQSELTNLKPILAKLDEHYREKLVDSFRSFAKQIAESSGGVLGFFSQTKEEQILIKLEMFD